MGRRQEGGGISLPTLCLKLSAFGRRLNIFSHSLVSGLVGLGLEGVGPLQALVVHTQHNVFVFSGLPLVKADVAHYPCYRKYSEQHPLKPLHTLE
jgi:hypothetical protein